MLAQVLQMLGSGQALAQHLEDYVVAFAVLGHLVAMQQGEVETLELGRKVAWAKSFSEKKTEDGKNSDRLCAAWADQAVADIDTEAIKARKNFSNLKSTREAVQEAIWSIKFLGKQGG